MNLQKLLHDNNFNVFFSLVVGIGLMCILRPMCTGKDCIVSKPPSEKDFDKYVYRMGGSTCYEFKTEVVECPSSGAIEAFESQSLHAPVPSASFSHRRTSIRNCD
jgi:hypothetical protein